MSRDSYFRQCDLRWEICPGVFRCQTAWIPEKVASVGAIVRLKDEEGLWMVTAVYGRQQETKLRAAQHDYANQRKVSDV